MRSLFIKIFLWFWVAMLVMGAAMLLLQRQWVGVHPLPAPSAMAAYAAEAERLLLRGQQADLADWLAQLNRESELRFLLVDEEARTLSGRRLPPHWREDLRALVSAPSVRRLGNRRASVQSFEVGGQRLHLVALLPPRHRLQDAPAWLRVALALAVSALVCLLLAAYISRPIRRVRRAAQRLAQGDLQARVERLRGRDEIAELGHDFNAMAARLQQLLEAQSQLLRDVSHELRSPLHRLQVGLELARRAAGTEAEPALARIELEAERLNDLIGQVLALARLEAGAGRLEPGPVDLAELVAEIIEDAQFEAGEERTVTYDGPPHLRIRGDAALLRAAIENVIRNALRYTPEHSAVTVELDAGADAVLTVRDRGPGVPEADLVRIFQPFVRVSSARERSSGGHGLGLAIAERAVRAHGGRIEARNGPAGGLNVVLRLPLSGMRAPEPQST
jgi:signal transduction histidine kinase